MGNCDGYVTEANCAERRGAIVKVCQERHRHEFPTKEEYEKDIAEVKTLKADKDTVTESMRANAEGNKATRLLIYVVLAAIVGQYVLAIFRG
jgi:hypothetical protein